MAFPKIGNLAPLFSLKNQRGEAVTLKDYRGERHVLLYFYPRASTPGCTVQACGMRDSAAALAHNEMVVLAVSPDPIKRLQNFTAKQSLNFDLLSDEDHAVADKYGAWGLKKFMGREYDGILRSSFIIGKDGRLKAIFDKVKTKTHHEDMIDWVESNL